MECKKKVSLSILRLVIKKIIMKVEISKQPLVTVSNVGF
jgi:hypothetical protein